MYLHVHTQAFYNNMFRYIARSNSSLSAMVTIIVISLCTSMLLATAAAIKDQHFYYGSHQPIYFLCQLDDSVSTGMCHVVHSRGIQQNEFRISVHCGILQAYTQTHS